MEDALSDTTATEEFIIKFENRSWGFAYVKSRTEKKLLAKLNAKKIPCYLPLIRKMRIHHRGKVFTDVPMFPSYVFFCPEKENITDIKNQNEVVGVSIVEDVAEKDFIKELNLIRKFELFSQNHNTIVNPEIQPGQTVLIKNGPLQNTEVVVVRRLGEVSIIVNLHFLGRSCECNIQADELKLLI